MDAIEWAKSQNKRFRKLKNGSVQVRGRIRIGSGTSIGSDASIGSDVFTLKGSGHKIYAHSPNKIGIGCKVYDLDFWLSNYENIGLHNSYSVEQIQEYGRYLKFISDNRDLVFKCFVFEEKV